MSKSSVSAWVRDAPFIPSPRRTGPKRNTHAASRAKQRQIEELDMAGVLRIGRLFEVDESRLRARVYLHQGLDIEPK